MAKQNPDAARLKSIVQSFPGVLITVLADLMADEFVYGEISRVSREAPVLILRHRERTVLPGGGGNAVMNLASLGVKVFPVGVVGNDDPGELLMECFRKERIPTDGITRLKGLMTTTKTRILAGTSHSSRQQVVRVDREAAVLSDGQPATKQLVKAVSDQSAKADALLVSDYGYGAATPAILRAIRAKAGEARKPITLDSRYRMLEYARVTAATDNERLFAAGKQLLQRMQLESLVITRGRDGMVAFEKNKEPLVIPIFGSDQVVDVTGAGDTVIATFTAALATGADTTSAAQLANLAGGIVVMKRGTATVSRRELLATVDKYAAAKKS